MKNTMKFFLVMAPLICTTLYGAQPPREEELYNKIVSDFLNIIKISNDNYCKNNKNQNKNMLNVQLDVH